MSFAFSLSASDRASTAAPASSAAPVLSASAGVAPLLEARLRELGVKPLLCAGMLREVTMNLLPHAGHCPLGCIDTLMENLREHSAAASDWLRRGFAELMPRVGWHDDTGNGLPGSGTYWLYDPIDGAYHFAQGLHGWSASLCLVLDGEVVMALVYDAMQGEMFSAVKGQGAFLDDDASRWRESSMPLGVSNKAALLSAVAGVQLPPVLQNPEVHRANGALIQRLASQVFITRAMASSSLQLAHVAASRLDAHVEIAERKTTPEDWLAGALLVREAGGQVTDSAVQMSVGEEGASTAPVLQGIIATNAAFHAPLQQLMAQALLA